jgi:transposase
MKLSGDSAQEYRFDLIVKLRGEGRTQQSIAQLAQCSQCWVSKVLRRSKSSAGAPLTVSHALGHSCRLSDSDLEKLKSMLVEGAIKYDFPTDNWTRERIAELIQSQFKVTYHVSHLSKLMRKIGFSLQKPKHRSYRKDDEAVAQWLSETLPALKKSA